MPFRRDAPPTNTTRKRRFSFATGRGENSVRSTPYGNLYNRSDDTPWSMNDSLANSEGTTIASASAYSPKQRSNGRPRSKKGGGTCHLACSSSRSCFWVRICTEPLLQIHGFPRSCRTRPASHPVADNASKISTSPRFLASQGPKSSSERSDHQVVRGGGATRRLRFSARTQRERVWETDRRS